MLSLQSFFMAHAQTVLAETAGEACVGDAVSLADCCLVPQVYNATRQGKMFVHPCE